MADPHPGYAAPSLAPGPSPPRQPERRQITPTEVAYVSVGARHPSHPISSTRPHKSNAPPKGRQPTTGPCPLDSTYSQLGAVHADRRHAHDDYVGPVDVNRLSVRSAVARVETP